MELGGYVLERLKKAATNPADNLLGDLASRCASGELDQIAALRSDPVQCPGGESISLALGSTASIWPPTRDSARCPRQP